MEWEPFYLLIWAFTTIKSPLNTSFAAILKFWCCGFIFIHLECFLLSFVMSYLTHWLSKSVMFLFLHHWVLSDSLRPHGLQDTRLICPLLSPRVCSNSCPLTQWCHLTISFCHPLLLLSSIFPSIRVFYFLVSRLFASGGQWMHWRLSFSITTSNEYSRLISFRID